MGIAGDMNSYMNSNRSIINTQFWNSFLSLSRYSFKSFTVKRVHGMDFFKKETNLAFISRIENLKADTKAIWGSMRVEQMLHHLNLSMGSGQGFYELPDESYLLSRTVIKWIVIDWYSEQPRGLELPLSMSIPSEAIFDFNEEKKQLLLILHYACQAKVQSKWKPHPYFGKLTVKQWGKLCLIHIDYHLKQFAS